MDHSAYTRIVPGSDTAVLMIHGIMGTPRHFDDLIAAVPEDWSVYNLLLDGHGGSTLDFGRSSMEKWKNQTMAAFRDLCEKYRRVIPVGHSMGTLFAIRMAVERPEKVPFLFLLASPLAIGLRPVMVENSLRVAFGRVREEDPRQTATRDACSVATTWRLWEYLSWVPRYLELFREIGRVRKLLPDLEVPCYAFQSREDELVSRRAEKILENSGRVRVMVLADSAHFYYSREDKKRLISEFAVLCETIAQKCKL